jgi:hypothetical protein
VNKHRIGKNREEAGVDGEHEGSARIPQHRRKTTREDCCHDCHLLVPEGRRFVRNGQAAHPDCAGFPKLVTQGRGLAFARATLAPFLQAKVKARLISQQQCDVFVREQRIDVVAYVKGLTALLRSLVGTNGGNAELYDIAARVADILHTDVLDIRPKEPVSGVTHDRPVQQQIA